MNVLRLLNKLAIDALTTTSPIHGQVIIIIMVCVV